MIELRTLGAIGLRRDGQDVRSLLSQPKRFALLVYLALAPEGGARSRDALLALFWPDSDDERARNSLRQALHFVRRSLVDGVVVSQGDRDVAVSPTLLACDASGFLGALEDGRLEEALELYQGEFLPGFHLDDAPDLVRWIDETRSELRRRAAAAAETLTTRDEARGELRAAVLWARRACALAPGEEAPVRRLLELLGRAGEVGAALEAFAEHERRLEIDFGVGPAPETLAVVARLREGQGGATPPAPSSPSGPGEGGPTPVAQPARADDPPGGELPSVADAVADPVSARPSDAPARPLLDPPRREDAGVVDAPPPEAPSPFRRFAGIAAVGVALLGAAWFVHLRMGAQPGLAETPPSLAVLPFVNLTGDPAQEYLGDGLTEELLNVMASVPGLQVTARTSSFAFKGKDVPVDSVGRALGVSHVLEGSVRRSGDDIRVTAQLVETETGFHLWSHTFDGTAGDLFGLQDRMSRAIGRELHLRLVGIPAGSRGEAAVPRAHELLLRANQTFRRGGRDAHAEAAALLEEAVRLDPGYVRARATLANVLVTQGQNNVIPRDSAYARARVLAEGALEEQELPEAHLVLARLANVQVWDTAAADAHYRRALELSPGDSRALQQRGTFLGSIGRHDEAIALLRRAVEVDPLNQGAHSNLGAVLNGAERVEEAIASYRQGLLISPGDPLILANLANSLSRLGRYEEAIAAIDSAFAGDPGDEYLLGLRGFLELRAGMTQRADATLALLESRVSTSRYRLATLYGIKGDMEKVLHFLEEAVARREEEVLTLRDPTYFPGLRQHPRMIRILEQIDRGFGADTTASGR